MPEILFASDLHGNRAAYERLFALKGDAIVLGGDLLPHPRGEGIRLLEVQRQFARDFLAPLLRSRPVYWILGNDDWGEAGRELEGAGTPIHGRAIPFLGGYWIAGYSCVPLTPFVMKDFDRYDHEGWEPPEPSGPCLGSGPEGIKPVSLETIRDRGTIAEDLRRLGALSDPGRTIYVMHSPPWDSGLDLVWNGTRLGSPSVRAFLEERQPPLSLHGHIHESPGVRRLGRTVCINPGDAFSAFRAVRVDLRDFRVTPLR